MSLKAFSSICMVGVGLSLAACGTAPGPLASGGTEGIARPLSTSAPGPLLGAYDGNQGWEMDQVRALESWQGRKNAVVNMFTNWCSRSAKNLYGQQLLNIWRNGNVPLVTWEPFLCSGDSDDIERRIAHTTEFDAYITSWARQMRTFLAGPDGIYGTTATGTNDDRRVYLRLAHEMNGDWYRWSAAVGNNSPADYVAMWKKVHRLVNAELERPDQTGGSVDRRTRLAWMWCVNHTDVGSVKAEQYFPGAAYVDWLAIDGYNWGGAYSWSTWTSPEGTFGASNATTQDPTRMLARLHALDGAAQLPVALTEVATTTIGQTSTSGAGSKSQWITDLMSYSVSNGIDMVVWFNEDKETDWALFGGTGGDTTFKVGRTTYRGYASYPAALATFNLTPAMPSAQNVRLLTDLQFNP